MAIAKLSIDDTKESKPSFLDLSFLLKAGADPLGLRSLDLFAMILIQFLNLRLSLRWFNQA